MSPLLVPRQINHDELVVCTGRWLDLMKPTPDKESQEKQLRACLSSAPDSLLNYVYLPGNFVENLLKTESNACWVRTYFAVTDRDIVDGQGAILEPIFTTVIVLADKDGNDILPYYQAGVTTRAEVYIDGQTPLRSRIQNGAYVSMDGIPPSLAEQRICDWNILDSQQDLFPLFLSEALPDSLPLRSYLFPIDDFQDAWEQADPEKDAIWLNFDLCSRDSLPDEILRFSTTVTVDANPTDNPQARITLLATAFYGDLSRPCPPACLIYAEA